MRTLVPAETLVYLETNDLAAALQPIVDAKPFKEVAKSKPDFSALKGVQLAVAVTGFETSEEKLTDEHSVGRVQPRFVAVADTHAWNYQAVAFAEKKLGGFVADIYDSEPKLERSDKHGGKYFVWTAKDGRKAYALVIDSIIYFGNDESAIDKCLAVKRGEADSVAKAGKVKSASQEILASGYVSTDGIAQIANLAGLPFASQSSDESEVQSAIAGILPQLIRNSVSDISWTATKTEQGIEDKYQITMPAEIANVLSETIAGAEVGSPSVETFVSGSAASVTRYNLKNPKLAWQSALASIQKKADPIAGRIVAEIALITIAPYGIADPEMFLSSVASRVLTIRSSADGEDVVVIAEVANYENIKKSISKDIDFSRPPSQVSGEEYWQSADGDLAFARHMGFVLIGSPESIRHCLAAKYSELYGKTAYADRLSGNVPITTVGGDTTTTLPLVEMLAREGHGETQAVSTYLTETRFTKTGMERKTTSDFGLIGAIIAQLAQD